MWEDVDAPPMVRFGYDALDKALLYRAVRENRTVVQNLMNRLYPGWRWGLNRRFESGHDGRRIQRRPEDVTPQQVLSIFFKHDSFSTPLARLVEGRTGGVPVTSRDVYIFLKVLLYRV